MCNAAGRYTPPNTRSPVHVRALRADQPIRTDVHLRQSVGRRTGQDHGPASETAEPRPEIDFRAAVYACIINTCDYKSIISSSLGVVFHVPGPFPATVPIPGIHLLARLLFFLASTSSLTRHLPQTVFSCTAPSNESGFFPSSCTKSVRSGILILILRLL